MTADEIAGLLRALRDTGAVQVGLEIPWAAGQSFKLSAVFGPTFPEPDVTMTVTDDRRAAPTATDLDLPFGDDDEVTP